MKTHIRHKISKTAHLWLVEHSSQQFEVTYLTHEGTDEDGREHWYCNNGQIFTSYSEALRCFNLRRGSDQPFQKTNVGNIESRSKEKTNDNA